DNSARVWTLQTPSNTGDEFWIERLQLDGHEGGVVNAVYSPDGAIILTAAWSDKSIRLWSAVTGKEVDRLERHQDLTGRALFDPAGRWVVTVSGDNTARLWELAPATGKRSSRWTEIARFVGHDSFVSSASFSPDRSRLATFSVNEHTARIWRLPSSLE